MSRERSCYTCDAFRSAEKTPLGVTREVCKAGERAADPKTGRFTTHEVCGSWDSAQHQTKARKRRLESSATLWNYVAVVTSIGTLVAACASLYISARAKMAYQAMERRVDTIERRLDGQGGQAQSRHADTEHSDESERAFGQ